mmetsp:Transcript_38073/g.49989  ORF Transcript_38073/g.49989 Transcript_38073/m.49989 type:complete len:96 (+) Transcript_38073:857-1144(+)
MTMLTYSCLQILWLRTLEREDISKAASLLCQFLAWILRISRRVYTPVGLRGAQSMVVLISTVFDQNAILQHRAPLGYHLVFLGIIIIILPALDID